MHPTLTSWNRSRNKPFNSYLLEQVQEQEQAIQLLPHRTGARPNPGHQTLTS
jgi:hypothetical protein